MSAFPDLLGPARRSEPSARFPGHYKPDQIHVGSIFDADGSTLTVRGGGDDNDLRSPSPTASSAFKTMSDGFASPLPAITVGSAPRQAAANTIDRLFHQQPQPQPPISPFFSAPAEGEWTPRKLERAPTIQIQQHQLGTHRFSLVGKRVPQLAAGEKAKKGSARESVSRPFRHCRRENQAE